MFLGLGISLIYGLASASLIYALEGQDEFQNFLFAYNISFKTLVSLGLILGTTFILFGSQNLISERIEKAFPDDELEGTNYLFYKNRFNSLWRSVTFSASFIVAGFIIFTYCRFPLSSLAESLMIIPACVQYGLGVYIGRKLCYAGLMLHSLVDVPVTRNLFKERELDELNSYVHIISTLTIVFVYIHVMGYYSGPFSYKSIFGQSTKILLILPAFIATPVLLIFNFYPRIVLRRLYSKSIDVEVKRLREKLKSEKLSHFEKESYLLEVDRMSREELRYSMQLTLSDLPIGITILIMILEPLLGK
jgi:hypothetical protein